MREATWACVLRGQQLDIPFQTMRQSRNHGRRAPPVRGAERHPATFPSHPFLVRNIYAATGETYATAGRLIEQWVNHVVALLDMPPRAFAARELEHRFDRGHHGCRRGDDLFRFGRRIVPDEDDLAAGVDE